ncbi:MAG TPA: hypothetical protein VGL34_07080 [Steroidobacteraceae bacterium]
MEFIFWLRPALPVKLSPLKQSRDLIVALMELSPEEIGLTRHEGKEVFETGATEGRADSNPGPGFGE